MRLCVVTRNMSGFIKHIILLTIICKLNICTCYIWENTPCSSDPKEQLNEGIQENIGRFPWLGVVQHSFYIAGKPQYAISGAILIHSVYAIAAAEDMAKIIPELLKNNTKLILWKNSAEKFAIDVKDYTLHPEYHRGITTATIALLDLVSPDEAAFSDYQAPVRPVCLPIVGSGTYNEIYAVKVTDVTGELQKEGYAMKYVNRRECEEFYYQSHLYYEKMNPSNPLCAVSINNTNPCVWDAGVALITRQSWGFWQLIGFGPRGPGCSAPTKFLNIHDYLPWINDVIVSTPLQDYEDEYKIGLRRLSPIKLVMYPAHTNVPKFQGQCRKHERGTLLFREDTEVNINKEFVQGFYLLVLSQVASFYCAKVEMDVSRRTNAAMWVENNCHRDAEGYTIQKSGLINQNQKFGTQPRSIDIRRLECFLYFKSTAFVEIRFYFSFKAVIKLAIYGDPNHPEKIANPFQETQATTSWWPTPSAHRLRSWSFVPQGWSWYDL